MSKSNGTLSNPIQGIAPFTGGTLDTVGLLIHIDERPAPTFSSVAPAG